MIQPPDRIKETISDCIFEIDRFICDLLNRKIDGLPDLEETIVVFIDSVILGSFCYSFNNRLQSMDFECRKRYINIALKYIDKFLLNKMNESREDNGIEFNNKCSS